MSTAIALPEPRSYFPMANGRYEVTAGLKRLGDGQHFQIDRTYLAFMQAKAESRRQDAARVYLTHDLSPALHRAVVRFMIDTLPAEHPVWFATEHDGAIATFHNRLLGLSARLDMEALIVLETWTEPALLPEGPAVYAAFDFTGCEALDYVTLHLQEDWALTSMDPATKADWVSALHISYPNHWAPEEKIGLSFLAVHMPVAAIEPTLKAAPALLETMIYKGTWERFAWAIATSTTLNRHPSRLSEWDKRVADESPAGVGASTFVRVEREVLVGFAEAHGSIFMIRTYFLPMAEVGANPEQAAALAAALRSMKPESVVYKGLTRLMDPLLAYLDPA